MLNSAFRLATVSLLIVCFGAKGTQLSSLPACFDVTSSPWNLRADEVPRAARLTLTSEPFYFELYGPDPLGFRATLFFETGDSASLAWHLSEGNDTLSASFGVHERYALIVTPAGDRTLDGELRWEDDGGGTAVSSVLLHPVGCAEVARR